jgi:ferrous iron transport protein B
VSHGVAGPSRESIVVQEPDRATAGAAIVALVGNPNTGKSALFNALTGFRRHVANYPGVSVDVARGLVRGAARPIQLLDLPGSYSLAANSIDEMVLCNALCGRTPGQSAPSAIVAVVDASNLFRNFYLLSQVLELGLPVVVALNMVDIAARRGITIDTERLSKKLGCPVVPVVATRTSSVAPLVGALEGVLASPDAQQREREVELPAAMEAEVARVQSAAVGPIGRAEAIRVLVDRDGHAQEQYQRRGGDLVVLESARENLREANLEPGPSEARSRYQWVGKALQDCVLRDIPPGRGWSDRIDRILTHRYAGAAILLFVLYTVFYSIYSLSGPMMDGIEALFGWVGAGVAQVVPQGAIRSVIVDGLISGVGGVLVFLPQILILFAFIALLEDCGYLARAAFMVDRVMRPLGLSGRAFIPLLSSFACAVPAIMGARAIADRRERFITILITPFMSCSARLPVYVLLISAFVSSEQAWLGGWLRLDALVMLGVYLVGVVFAIPIAWILKKLVFVGPPAGFLLELPTYKMPRLRAVWQRLYLAGHGFVVRAGTVILVVNLVVWALGYYPRSSAVAADVRATARAENWDQQTLESELAGAYLRTSYLGQMGQAIEPVIEPLGWDWRIGVGVIASFPAREVVIATLGTVLNLGEAEAESKPLQEAVRDMRWDGTGEPVFTLPVALSVMVFFALCAQCSATLVTLGRELGSWIWPVISFVGMTTLAYFAAWGVSVGAAALGL